MVDILMATYNSEKYIKEQLDSILSQTIANWRLVIRDDCSSDNTLEILKAYEAKYPEHIFVHQAKTNSGGADKNFFELINYALYDYVMFCDQDDVWENNKVELSLKKILALEQQYGNIPLLVHCDAKVVDDELNLISNSLFDFEQLSKTNTSINKLIAQNNVTGCTMMVNKPLLDMIKSPPKNDIMHDWWLALIASCFGKIGFIDKPLMLYRQHFNNSVGAKNTKSLLYNLKRAFNKSGSEKVLNDTFLQAEEFLNTYEKLLNENDKTLIENYVKIPHMNKFMKIITLFKYDFLKHSLKRKLGQILYI